MGVAGVDQLHHHFAALAVLETEAGQFLTVVQGLSHEVDEFRLNRYEFLLAPEISHETDYFLLGFMAFTQQFPAAPDYLCDIATVIIGSPVSLVPVLVAQRGVSVEDHLILVVQRGVSAEDDFDVLQQPAVVELKLTLLDKYNQ